MAQQIPFSFLAPASPPVLGVLTIDRTNVEGTELDTTGDVVSEGGDPVTDKGICWSTNPNPTISDDSISSGGGGLGSFSIPVAGLLNETTYYFRAYATNTIGTGYSSQIVVESSYEPLILEVTTTAASELFNIIKAGSTTLDITNHDVNVYIDWGDGNPIENIISSTNVLAGSGLDHTYASTGSYTIKMSGDCPRLARCGATQGTSSVNLEEWGTQPWKVLYRAFYTSPNFEIIALDTPVLSAVDLNDSRGLQQMFRGSDFLGNASMSSWDVSGIEMFSNMFYECSNFNINIGSWNTSSATRMARMFQEATSFNQDISSWDVSNVEDFTALFYDPSATMAFNQNLDSWDTSSAYNFSYMFNGTNVTNSTLTGWTTDTSLIGFDMAAMFEDALYVPTGIVNWNLSSGNSGSSMTAMFRNCLGTIPNIGIWDTSTFQSMAFLFVNTTFNHDISSWDITNLNSGGLNGFMQGVTTFSTANYDALLIAWEAQAASVPALSPDFGSSQYTLGGAAETAHTNLINTYGWSISDGGGI